MKRIQFSMVVLVALLAGLTISCEKEFDAPPIKDIPVGNVKTIEELRQLYADSGRYSIKEEWSVFGVINSDERTGNLYKTIYMQDTSGAISLRLIYSGGVYKGDSVRIYLKGTVIDEVNGLLQIDSVDTDFNVIKQKTLVNIVPDTVTISELGEDLESHLIVLKDVQFNYVDLGQTYAEPEGNVSKNRIIEDCDGNQIILRNSGYANFAGEEIPQGSGTIEAVLGEYNGTLQLYLNSLEDIDFSNERCPGSNVILYKGFEDESLTSGGWTTYTLVGGNQFQWEVGNFSGNDAYAQASGYNFGNNQTEMWYISPAMDLTGDYSSLIFSFDNAYNYSGPAIEVYISNDYDGAGNISSATWTEFSNVNLSSGGFSWTNSGDLDISSYINQTSVYVAFKYTSTTSGASTWEIDNIIVAE